MAGNLYLESPQRKEGWIPLARHRQPLEQSSARDRTVSRAFGASRFPKLDSGSPFSSVGSSPRFPAAIQPGSEPVSFPSCCREWESVSHLFYRENWEGGFPTKTIGKVGKTLSHLAYRKREKGGKGRGIFTTPRTYPYMQGFLKTLDLHRQVCKSDLFRRTRGDFIITVRKEPVVGRLYVVGEEIIMPTYVAISERPLPNGACVTRDYTFDFNLPGGKPIDAAGWYVEFHYPGLHSQYRRFIPFDETQPTSETGVGR